MKSFFSKNSPTSWVIALGGAYAVIGFAPAFLFQFGITGNDLDRNTIFGFVSCAFWSLTVFSTFKYILLYLRADSYGNGGVMALFMLVRRRKKYLVYFAMIGTAGLLTEAIIFPSFAITYSIEKLQYNGQIFISQSNFPIFISIGIIFFIWLLHRIFNDSIAKISGLLVAVWFLVTGIFGIRYIIEDWQILSAINPVYAVRFIFSNPNGFSVLGTVFLITVGSEILYHQIAVYGRKPIRYFWVYIKLSILLCIFGQGAYLLKYYSEFKLPGIAKTSQVISPFFDQFPKVIQVPIIFLTVAIIIIGCNALINSSFSMIEKAIRTRLWPKVKIHYSGKLKGKMVIQSISTIILGGSCIVILLLKDSTHIMNLFGFGTIISLLTGTFLYTNYLVMHRVARIPNAIFFTFYILTETVILISLFYKFFDGGYFAILLMIIFFLTMYVIYKSKKIRNREIEFIRIEHNSKEIVELSNNSSIQKFASNIVFFTAANNPKEIEHKIIRSIFHNKPKRADIYWLIHVDRIDEPLLNEYSITNLIPEKMIRVEFRIGYRNDLIIEDMFNKVTTELLNNGEIMSQDLNVKFGPSNILKDVRFVIIEEKIPKYLNLTWWDSIVVKTSFWLKSKSQPISESYGLDEDKVLIEKLSILNFQPEANLIRTFDDD